MWPRKRSPTFQKRSLKKNEFTEKMSKFFRALKDNDNEKPGEAGHLNTKNKLPQIQYNYQK